jgi:hypothetical protein
MRHILTLTVTSLLKCFVFSPHPVTAIVAANRNVLMAAQAVLQLYTPEPPSTDDAQNTLIRRPRQIPHLKPTLPHRTRSPFLAHSLSTTRRRSRIIRRRTQCGIRTRHQVPNEYTAVVSAGSKYTALRIGPLDAVDRGTVAFEFQEGLTWLAHVEDADGGGVRREGGEEVRIVRGGGDAEEGRWVGQR